MVTHESCFVTLKMSHVSLYFKEYYKILIKLVLFNLGVM